MKTLYDVTANHPVAKRIDELRLTEVDKNDLVAELIQAGYEVVDIDVKGYNCYEEGDEILITKEIYDNGSDRGRELIRSMFGTDKFIKDVGCNFDQLLPFKGTISAERMDRFMGQLVIEWQGTILKGRKTNTHWLENKIDGMGLHFIHPEFEEISIMNCEDKYLTERELVVKTYALQNGLPEEESKFLIGIVQSAMSKHGIVFYRP